MGIGVWLQLDELKGNWGKNSYFTVNDMYYTLVEWTLHFVKLQTHLTWCYTNECIEAIFRWLYVCRGVMSDWCVYTHNYGLHSLLGRCYLGLSCNLPHQQTPAEGGRLCDKPSKEHLHRRLWPELLHGISHLSTRLPLMFDSPMLPKYWNCFTVQNLLCLLYRRINLATHWKAQKLHFQNRQE